MIPFSEEGDSASGDEAGRCFSRQVDSQPHEIYTVNADGSGLFNVTNTPDISEFGADWGIHPLTP